MPPAATLCFTGFPGVPTGEVPLAGDGGPVAAARLLAAACPLPGEDAARLPQRFGCRHRPVPSGPPAAAGGEACLFRYEVRFHPRRRQPLWVEAWRRYPGAIGWQRRCGPMPLQCFLRRFLPPAGSPGVRG
ncbi:MAG: hypothetical protein VKI81_08535 [Synechococcaceae cyanobacterium]|nr:hypothetical protein [Synechococcaceae cyanobacterium]